MSQFYHVLPLTPGFLSALDLCGSNLLVSPPQKHGAFGHSENMAASLWRVVLPDMGPHGSVQIVAVKVWEAVDLCVWQDDAGNLQPCQMVIAYYHHRTCTGICWHSTWLSHAVHCWLSWIEPLIHNWTSRCWRTKNSNSQHWSLQDEVS